MTKKYNYFCIVLEDDTIGIVNQYYILYYLRKFHKLKQSKPFYDLNSAKRWIVQYIFVNLSLEDYGITDINDESTYHIEVNEFIRGNELEHKLLPLDVLFDHHSPRRKCMLRKQRIKKAKDGFYTVVILKNDTIGIFESKALFDEIKNNGYINHYKLFYTYKEADEYIRKMIPFHEWSSYHLDVGYLKVNNLLKRGQDEYEDLSEYCTVDLEDLQLTGIKKHKPKDTYSQYLNQRWEAPPMKTNFHYNPGEIHKVRTSGYINMDENDKTPIDNSKREYESYYNEELRQWVHKKKRNN